jgi:adenylate kinase
MRIVLLGAPGSGKGTQAGMLAEHYRIPKISIGDVIRGYEEDNPEIALQAKMSSDTFHHLPEDLAFSALKDRLSAPDVQSGFLLVSFPRTAVQGDRLDEILESLNMPIDLVLQLDGDSDVFMERLEGRRICQSCGQMYNIFTNPPRVEGICDQCGGQIRRRADDNEQTISTRMRIYEHQIASLAQYYKLHGKLRTVSAELDQQALFRALCNVIEATPPTVVVTEPISEPPVALKEHTMVSGSDTTPDEKTVAASEEKPQAIVAANEPAAETAAPPEAAAPAKKKAVKKAVVKKAASKKTAAKKSAKKAAVKKASPSKKKAAKKAAVKKAAPKKKAAKKATVKKSAAKKTVKKSAAKKAAVKKTTTKKTAAKKTVKKSVAKKAPIKKASAKKSAVKKAPAKKVTAKKAPAKKAAVKKSPVKKAAARKTVAKKSPARKPAGKKVAAKKAPVKKAPVKKAPAKKVAVKKKSAKKSPVKKAATKKK